MDIRNETYHTETLTARKRRERKNRVAVFLFRSRVYIVTELSVYIEIIKIRIY